MQQFQDESLIIKAHGFFSGKKKLFLKVTANPCRWRTHDDIEEEWRNKLLATYKPFFHWWFQFQQHLHWFWIPAHQSKRYLDLQSRHVSLRWYSPKSPAGGEVNSSIIRSLQTAREVYIHSYTVNWRGIIKNLNSCTLY